MSFPKDFQIAGRLANKLVYGTNIKRSGEERDWNGAKCTGKFRYSSYGEVMIEVFDFSEDHRGFKKGKRWINTSTFTGKIGSIELINGDLIHKLVS